MPIYFIQAGQDGPIKIGFSENPAQRFVKVQSDNPAECILLGVMAGDVATERELHAKLALHVIRGEWFRPASDVLAEVPAGEAIRFEIKAPRVRTVCPGDFAARSNLDSPPPAHLRFSIAMKRYAVKRQIDAAKQCREAAGRWRVAGDMAAADWCEWKAQQADAKRGVAFEKLAAFGAAMRAGRLRPDEPCFPPASAQVEAA